MWTWTLESGIGSATSIVPARIVKLPRTGASPNRCRVLNVTAEQLVSISYRPGRGVTCASPVPTMALTAPVLAWSSLRAAMLASRRAVFACVLCTLGGRAARDVTRKLTCRVESSSGPGHQSADPPARTTVFGASEGMPMPGHDDMAGHGHGRLSAG